MVSVPISNLRMHSAINFIMDEETHRADSGPARPAALGSSENGLCQTATSYGNPYLHFCS